MMKDMEHNITKELPYGIQDFVQVIEQGFYYVDKTMFIPNLEEGYSNLFCIRPRRFGKSVLLSMLHAYYDCRTKDKFQEWFGDILSILSLTNMIALSIPCLITSKVKRCLGL